MRTTLRKRCTKGQKMVHKWVCPKCGHVFKTAVVLTQPPQHSHNNGRKYIDMEKLDEQETCERVDNLAD